MKKVVAGIFLISSLIIFLFIVPIAFAFSYYYPLENTLQRKSYKTFAQYIDQNFYEAQNTIELKSRRNPDLIGAKEDQNNPDLYPTKYIGYHTATDWEIIPEELNKKVPVYAISDSILTYQNFVSGYGGVVILYLIIENLSVLYGHLDISQIKFSVGENIPGKTKIAYLADNFSTNSGGERQHLHFAIYKGKDLYFKGYEENKNILLNKFIDPVVFLKNKRALNPLSSSITPTVIKKEIYSKLVKENNQKEKVWQNIFNFFYNLFTK